MSRRNWDGGGGGGDLVGVSEVGGGSLVAESMELGDATMTVADAAAWLGALEMRSVEFHYQHHMYLILLFKDQWSSLKHLAFLLCLQLRQAFVHAID